MKGRILTLVEPVKKHENPDVKINKTCQSQVSYPLLPSKTGSLPKREENSVIIYRVLEFQNCYKGALLSKRSHRKGQHF